MDGQLLDQILERVNGLDPKAQAELAKIVESAGIGKFVPSPGPQTDAWNCKADILLYGGQAGGGKSSLGIGLALAAHRRSLIMRRRYTDLSGLTDETIKFNGTRRGFNGAAPPSLRTDDDRLIEFGACQHLGDEEAWFGRAHDLLVFDEGWQFLEHQVRILMTWVRSAVPGQRCRVLIPTNPPLSADGEWLVRMFAPWVDDTYPNPAAPGELRWFVTDDAGKDIEVPGPEPVQVEGRELRPMSRTFIRSSVDDNPFLKDTDYKAKLDSLMPRERASMRDGNFMATRRDSDDQVIPSVWVKEAQARWKPQLPPEVPMCAVGVDPASGGECENVFALRYDGYYPELKIVPGRETPNGEGISGHIINHRRDGAAIVIDMAGGFGNLPFVELKNNDIAVIAHKGSEGSNARTKDGLFGFYNKRAEVIWRFREALDPNREGGSIICLPPDQQLVADLTSFLYDVVPYKGRSCIKIETKEEMVKRLGRSPDRGDAVIMAWSAGRTIANIRDGSWQSPKNRPLVARMGHEKQRQGTGRR